MSSQAPHFLFGAFKCGWSEAFYLSPLSLAIVNTKPVAPGHCLVLPRRVAPRLRDLSAAELADLWGVAAAVGAALEREFGAEAMTFAVQDGPAAGQTVPHVHVHLVPRRPGDFRPNDAVYAALDAPEAVRQPRSAEEMRQETLRLRPLFRGRSLALPPA